MSLLHIVVLACVQGLSEFLPISSSAHLILVPVFGHWPDQGLDFDIAVHVGTLIAVLVYFRHEMMIMTVDWLRSLRARRLVGESHLAWAVLWATVPVGLAGLAFHHLVETSLRSPLVIAGTTLFFGALLGLADWGGRRVRTEHGLNWKDVLIIGLAQAVALIPGTSRSGITMTAGLMLGLTREGAARFSFLLSIPVIVLAGGFKTLEAVRDQVPIDWAALGLGVMLSALTAYLCIHYFLKWLDRFGMWPFVVYRLVLGGILLGVFL